MKSNTKPRTLNGSLALVVALAAMASVASGCIHAQAKVAADLPALDVPAAPPRTVEAMVVAVPQPAGPPEAVPSGIDELNRAAVPRQTAPVTVRPGPPRQVVEPPKADVAVEPPKPPDDPRAQVASPLQSTPTQREAEVEAAVRADLRRANDNLNRVNVSGLSADARGQYNSARMLIQLAEQALAARNLVYAKSVAEKAGTLAAQLAGR